MSRLLPLTLLCAGLALATGCATVVRDRTLPPSVRSVYIPMIDNRTQEPGLEERFTIAFQEELLADGRLNVVREKEADAIVKLTLVSINDETLPLDPDGFSTVKAWNVQARMEVLENIPGRPRIGGRRRVKAAHVYNDDPRTTTFNPEPFEQLELAKNFGRAAVRELLTGEFEEEAPAAEEPLLSPRPVTSGLSDRLGID